MNPLVQKLGPDGAAAGKRLDKYLAQQLPGVSRARLQQWIKQGRVRLADTRGALAANRVKPRLLLSGQESIEVEWPRAVGAGGAGLPAQPEDIAIEILYEDDEVVVVNKPAGMVVHAGAGVRGGTLVNALLHHVGQLASIGGPLRPGIVHRLDRGTSGALIVAKTDAAHLKLSEQFRLRQVEKRYLALVHGRIKSDRGSITLPVARDRVRRVRMTTRRREGRQARTEYRVLGRLDGFTLVEATIPTGRTHQIRVHFSALGHPVVGDTLYGASRQIRLGGTRLPGLGRNFLHAALVRFRHPVDGRWMEIKAALPPELMAFQRALEKAL